MYIYIYKDNLFAHVNQHRYNIYFDEYFNNVY